MTNIGRCEGSAQLIANFDNIVKLAFCPNQIFTFKKSNHMNKSEKYACSDTLSSFQVNRIANVWKYKYEFHFWEATVWIKKDVQFRQIT